MKYKLAFSLSEIAKSVDPDLEQSDLGLHCFHMPFLSETLVYEMQN